jgi:hypothetical protein
MGEVCKEGLMGKIKTRLLATIKLATSQEEVELLLRAIIGGGALSFLLSNTVWGKITGVVLVLCGYAAKEWNNRRKG